MEETILEISNKIKDKVVESMSVSEGVEDFIVFTFKDGAVLRIRYDYIYECELTDN